LAQADPPLRPPGALTKVAALGKFGGGQKGGMPRLQVLEMQFNEMAGALFDRVMDLHQPNPALEKCWRELLQFRDQIKQQVKQVPQKAVGGQGAPAAGNEPNWKGEFYSELGKRMQRNVTKEDVQFEVQQMESEVPGQQGGWIASLACQSLSQQYQGDVVTANKKTAEACAAKVALQNEFPETFARLAGFPAQGKGKGNAKGNAQVQANSKKRKAPEPEVVEQVNTGEVKSRLTQAAQMLMGRPAEKGDVVYETVPDEGGTPGMFVGTVTLAGYDSTVGYQGFPALGKKAAESAAAEAAVAALQSKIEPLEADREANKKAKKKESLAVFKEKQKEKQSLIKAEKETP